MESKLAGTTALVTGASSGIGAATIETLRTNRRNSPPIPSSQRATPASLRERLDDLRDQITRLQSGNAALRDQLARRLGQDRTRP